MKTIIISAVFALATAFSSTTHAQITTKEMSVEAFDQIVLPGQINVILKEGATPKIVIEGEANALNNVKIKNKRGRLAIDRYAGSDIINVYVTVKNLSFIESYNGAQVASIGQLKAETMHLDVHENTIIRVDLDAERVEVTAYGNGKARVRGEYSKSSTFYDIQGLTAIIYKRKEVL